MVIPYDAKPETVLTERGRQLLSEIKERQFSVLCGRNNCGKSFLLKSLKISWERGAAYLGPARYQNFTLLGNVAPRKTSKVDDDWNNWYRQWVNESQNLDNSPWSLQQAIAELSDAKRDQLFEIMHALLGSEMEIRFTIPGNKMSQQFIAVDGHNISYTSSGYRLICTLVTSLLGEDYENYLIDEPELGISPEAQGAFSDFLFDREMRARYFGHVRSIVLATHSSLFLDRQETSNNYFVSKQRDVIDLERARSVADINRIHFFLLGNRLESIYMPTAVLIVEGKSDYKFIARVLQLRYPDTRFSVLQANGDARVRDMFHIARQLFGDFQRSPYSGRVFAVLDSVHSTGLTTQLVAMGIAPDNIVVWPKNGIEFTYPPAILERVFQASGEITVDGDQVSLNGLVYTKSDLADLVVSQLSAETVHSADFESGLLVKIEAVAGN